jgi:hypothetical protein
MEVSDLLHAPVSLPSRGKSPRYPLNSKLGGSMWKSERCGEDKYFVLLPGVSMPDELSRCSNKLYVNV